MSKLTKEFIKDRNNSLIEFVLNDDLKPIYKYCKKYNIEIPKNEKVLKGGLYKAVQNITSIPEEIKVIAFDKCIELGMYPFLNYGVEE